MSEGDILISEFKKSRSRLSRMERCKNIFDASAQKFNSFKTPIINYVWDFHNWKNPDVNINLAGLNWGQL